MATDGQPGESVARRYAVLRRFLDERQRRLVLGAEAAELGRGGIKTVALATGCIPTPSRKECVRSTVVSSPPGGCGRRAVAASRRPRTIRGSRWR